VATTAVDLIGNQRIRMLQVSSYVLPVRRRRKKDERL